MRFLSLISSFLVIHIVLTYQHDSIALQIKACTFRYHQRDWGGRTATILIMFANLVLLRFRDPHCQRGPWQCFNLFECRPIRTASGTRGSLLVRCCTVSGDTYITPTDTPMPTSGGILTYSVFSGRLHAYQFAGYGTWFIQHQHRRGFSLPKGPRSHPSAAKG
ncbi:uncharacterized protein B0T23DRAFT_237827 [Neurospora hispaniola]|uniref:Secreted protein n=1 Tax=Neurospora hispaniola TaxID=588809 RepID=A0AAJ0HZL7_9PEZI|nr:hypothetical protein B0T23DRAFT_237827 [Neurospora hispaniola]